MDYPTFGNCDIDPACVNISRPDIERADDRGEKQSRTDRRLDRIYMYTPEQWQCLGSESLTGEYLFSVTFQYSVSLFL